MNHASGCTVNCAAHGGLFSGNSVGVLVLLIILALCCGFFVSRRRKD